MIAPAVEGPGGEKLFDKIDYRILARLVFGVEGGTMGQAIRINLR